MHVLLSGSLSRRISGEKISVETYGIDQTSTLWRQPQGALLFDLTASILVTLLQSPLYAMDKLFASLTGIGGNEEYRPLPTESTYDRAPASLTTVSVKQINLIQNQPSFLVMEFIAMFTQLGLDGTKVSRWIRGVITSVAIDKLQEDSRPIQVS